ncbi:MAG: EAL domain-containing protein [Terracidiphilus sp.]|nr:EAL domain-containing protein [Terracidiphilus sp.]
MIYLHKHRQLFSRATEIATAVLGLVAGYFLGCFLALQIAENWLDHNSQLVAAQDNAAFEEARQLLTVLKNSPHPFCSEGDISFFRNVVFRSEYLKDAGRIRGGKIECSAVASYPALLIERFKQESNRQDGIVSYSSFAPAADANLKRVGLRLGTAFVVIGSHLPPGIGPFPIQFNVAMTETANVPSHASGDGKTAPTPADVPSDGVHRVGDQLVATRCSTLQFRCITASASVSKALRSEWDTVAASTCSGGLLGLLLGMAVCFVYNRSRDLCQQLRRAILLGKLQVAYQPIVDLRSKCIVGAEALARWSDEEGNAVSPDVFIKIAEQHGFIGDITRFVLERTLHDFAATMRHRPGFHVAVNVAADDLVDPLFMPMLDKLLARAKVPPSAIVIEITERSTADNPVAMETIRQLRRKGHNIHIDDFGTGYSNLDKLLYLFADTIKIDKAFTHVIGSESVTVALIPQILAIAKSLHLEVIVEGIETEPQADYFSLVEQKVYGQGWLYGRPVPPEAFLGLLAGNIGSASTASAEPKRMRIVSSRPKQHPQIA